MYILAVGVCHCPRVADSLWDLFLFTMGPQWMELKHLCLSTPQPSSWPFPSYFKDNTKEVSEIKLDENFLLGTELVKFIQIGI